MTDDFRDMLGLFESCGVDYLLVGAHAMAAHHVPRATGDMDLWVRPTADNARRVLQALTAFGAPMQNITAEDFTTPGQVVQLGVPPVRIDILTSIDGVEFSQAKQDCIRATLLGTQVSVIGKKHLIQNKRATQRRRDQLDADALEN